jgi:hypothetical protein
MEEKKVKNTTTSVYIGRISNVGTIFMKLRTNPDEFHSMQIYDIHQASHDGSRIGRKKGEIKQHE